MNVRHPRTLGSLRRAGAARLLGAGLPTPDLDARWLLAEAAGLPAGTVVLRENEAMFQGVEERFRALLDRRLGGEPVDRILGRREFWGLDFRLEPATLSPRPDTEVVVSAALAVLDGVAAPRILDLGTGSGAILVALLGERADAWGVGIDRSALATRQARDNAREAGVGERAAMLAGHWAAALRGRFDLVVSNPPYIPTAVLATLAPEVRIHDPLLALDGGVDGLSAYRAILGGAPALLAEGAGLVLELGVGQEEAVCALAAEVDLRPQGPALRDLGGVSRALTLRAG